MSIPDSGNSAFPVSEEHGVNFPHMGMTLRDYAAIHFAAAWSTAMGIERMHESRDQQAIEANRLGLLQANDFIARRGVASQPDGQEKK